MPDAGYAKIEGSQNSDAGCRMPVALNSKALKFRMPDARWCQQFWNFRFQDLRLGIIWFLEFVWFLESWILVLPF